MSDTGQNFSTVAWKKPASIAEFQIRQRLETDGGLPPECLAEEAVDYVFDNLREPDRDMISAGLGALDTAAARKRPVQQRELVEMIWTAMLRAAR